MAAWQRGGQANFAGDVGKGCEAINLVPSSASTPPDTGAEQADFRLLHQHTAPLPQPSSLLQDSKPVTSRATVTRLGTETELGVFKQKRCKWLSIEWPQTAREVHVTVTREMDFQDEAEKLPQLEVGPRWEGRLRPPWRQLPLKCLGVNNRYIKKPSLNV